MSDISVGSAGNNLTAHATAGGQDGSHNTALFTEMRGYTLNTGGGPNREESGYSRVASGYSYDYDDVRVLFSDIPVHTDLSIGGWAMVEGGVDDYYWSVDEGRTWNLCSGNPVDASPDGDQRYFWYDGSRSTTDTTATSMKSKLNFQVNKVTAELDDYVGECVDVIFGAKPKGSDVLCPVARINNVAVYGVDGTFYTRIHQVVFNVAADPTNEVNDEDIKYEKWYRDDSNTANATGLGTGEALVVDKFGNYLNCSDRWTGMNTYFNYNILSTQNISGLNTHLYTYDTVDVLSGGKIAIDGYVFCKNGVNRYKYSLDGGDTWTVIYDEVKAGYSDSQLTNAKKYDASFVAADMDGGDFCYGDSTNNLGHSNFSTWKGWTTKTVTEIRNTATTALREEKKAWLDKILTFSLPSVPEGEHRNLLVVAESNDASGNPSGKLIPVLNVNINFIYETGREFQFGTYRMVNNQTRPETGDVKENSVYWPTPTVPGTSTVNNIRARLTIPISEAGNYTVSTNIKMYKDENGGTLINDPKISCCIVQDSGEYTIFASVAMPLSHSDPRVIATWVNPVTNGVAAKLNGQRISLTFTATQADAERGYVVWDWDLTSLPLNVKYHWRLESMALTKNS